MLMYKIGPKAKKQLAAIGYPNLDTMLRNNLDEIPFQNCSGIGDKTSEQIKAILKANKSGNPVEPPASLIVPPTV